MKRRILVICPHFPPGTAPTSMLISELVERLAAAGYRIEVISSVPRREDCTVGTKRRHRLLHREETEWGRVTRVCAFWTSSTALRLRGPAALAFSALCALAGTFSRRRCDLVLTVSSPFLLGFAGAAVSRLRRVPFVFNVQDALADVVAASEVVSGIGSDALVSRLMPWMERCVYRSTDAVTVLSADMAAQVRARIGDDGSASAATRRRQGRRLRLGRNSERRLDTRVRVIPNFVDVDFVVPMPAENSYRAEFGLCGKTTIMYAGNVGLSQPIELMIDAAERFSDRDDVMFVVNGNGSTWDRYTAAAAGAANLAFVDHQETKRLPEVLAAADIHVVLLSRGLTGSSMPSKIYSVLAAARPIVASIDKDSEPARLLSDNGCGLVVAPEDPEAFAVAIAELVDDPKRREIMGERGRCLAESLPSAEDAAAAYEALFAELLQRGRHGHRRTGAQRAVHERGCSRRSTRTGQAAR